MANATIIRKATPSTEGTPEFKVEGKPYRAAKPGFIGDPGLVIVEMSVEEAKAVTRVLGGISSAGGISPTYSLWNTLDNTFPSTCNPFMLVKGDIQTKASGEQYVGNPYLTRKPTA